MSVKIQERWPRVLKEMLKEKAKALKEMLKKQKDIKDVKITCGENEAKLLLGRCQRHQESPS